MEKYPIPSKTVYLAALFVLLLLIGTEFAYRVPLYEASEQIISSLQKTGCKGFFQVMTTIGDGPIYIAIILVLANYISRSSAFYYVTFFVSFNWFVNTTKVAYHEGRPYLSFP